MGEMIEDFKKTLKIFFIICSVCVVFVGIFFGIYYYVPFPENVIIICGVLMIIACIPSIPRLHDA